MPSLCSRTLPTFVALITLAGWGCASDDESPTSPSSAPDLSTTATATYKIRDLGTLGGRFSHAYDINNSGVVVGASSLTATDIRAHAFVWKSGVMKDLGTLVGAHESQANAINVDGVVVGWSRNSAGDMRAVRWGADGRKRSLGTLGGRNSEARDINDFGVVVGWSETASGQRHAFRWANGVMTDIGTLGGSSSAANGINRGGVIVGQSTTASGEARAYKWKNGVFKNLGASVGALQTQFSLATAVNTLGQIVGELGPSLDAEGEDLDVVDGFVYYQETMRLCCRFNHPTTNVEDINSNGIIVGWEEDVRGESLDPSENAWVQEGASIARLPELAVGGHTGAEGINSRGDIVGYSQNSGGHTHAVLWKRQ